MTNDELDEDRYFSMKADEDRDRWIERGPSEADLESWEEDVAASLAETVRHIAKCAGFETVAEAQSYGLSRDHLEGPDEDNEMKCNVHVYEHTETLRWEWPYYEPKNCESAVLALARELLAMKREERRNP